MAVIKKESHQTWIGTAAEMALFTSMLAGDKFITTDTKLEYEYTGAAWIIKSTGVQLSGSILADETDKAATANTDILTDITATKTEMTTLMVATNTGGTLKLEVDGSLNSLNGGVALDAGKWYAFDIPILAASVYNLQLSASATMQIKWIGGF